MWRGERGGKVESRPERGTGFRLQFGFLFFGIVFVGWTGDRWFGFSKPKTYPSISCILFPFFLSLTCFFGYPVWVGLDFLFLLWFWIGGSRLGLVFQTQNIPEHQLHVVSNFVFLFLDFSGLFVDVRFGLVWSTAAAIHSCCKLIALTLTAQLREIKPLSTRMTKCMENVKNVKNVKNVGCWEKG